MCDDNLITLVDAQRPSPFLGRKGGPFLGAMEAPVIMVGTDSVEVERRLSTGEIVCWCGGRLARWGHARLRFVRGVGVLRPRRVRCVGCRVTHVLLSVACLWRRADGAEVIGAALRLKAAGAGHRPIADRLDRPATTVRGWLRAFTQNAATLRSVFTTLLLQLDPLHGPIGQVQAQTVLADAVEVVGAAAAAARRRLGVVGAVSPWQLASAVTNGRLLTPSVTAGFGQHELALGRDRSDPGASPLVCSSRGEEART
jgi:hypothetical protein